MKPLLFILRAESTTLRALINTLFLIAFIGSLLGYSKVPALRMVWVGIVFNLLFRWCKKVRVDPPSIQFSDPYSLNPIQYVWMAGFGLFLFDTVWNDHYHLSILYCIVAGLTLLALVLNFGLVTQTVVVGLSLGAVCLFLLPIEFYGIGRVEIFVLMGVALFWGMLYQEERRTDYPVGQSRLAVWSVFQARNEDCGERAGYHPKRSLA